MEEPTVTTWMMGGESGDEGGMGAKMVAAKGKDG